MFTIRMITNWFYFRRLDRDDARDEEVESLTRPKEQVTNDELHFGENWFHGKLSGGREEAERYSNRRCPHYVRFLITKFVCCRPISFAACCANIHTWVTVHFWCANQ